MVNIDSDIIQKFDNKKFRLIF